MLSIPELKDDAQEIKSGKECLNIKPTEIKLATI